MVHLKTLIRKEDTTLKEQAIKQLERQGKTMKLSSMFVMFRDCPECEVGLELQPEERDIGIAGLYYCPKCEYTEEI